MTLLKVLRKAGIRRLSAWSVAIPLLLTVFIVQAQVATKAKTRINKQAKTVKAQTRCPAGWKMTRNLLADKPYPESAAIFICKPKKPRAISCPEGSYFFYDDSKGEAGCKTPVK